MIYKVGDIVNCLDYRRIPVSSKERENRKGIYPYYGAQGIVDYIDDYIFDGAFLLVAEDGENLRSNNEPIARIARGKYWVNNHAHILESNGKCDIRYLCYCLNTINIRGYITGSAQPKLNQDNLLSISINLPPLEKQVYVADVLDVLDRKISLNTRMNAELEAMAKQLYDYWFVQFDFPDVNGKPYKSSGGKMVWNEKLKREIPEGWDVKSLGDIISKIDSGKRPTGGIDKSLKTGIPSLGAECIDELGVFDFSSTPYISNQYRSKLTSGRIEDNDILIYKDGAYVGKTTLFRDQFPYEEAFVNEHVFLIRANNIELEEYLLFTLKSETYFQIMQALGKAKAAQPGLNQQDLKQISVLIPDGIIALKYNAIVDNLFKSLFANAKQIARLINMRDELLPMLMNGQITIE